MVTLPFRLADGFGVRSVDRPRRISLLIIGNGLIPTVQLSFLKPLKDAMLERRAVITFWSERYVRAMARLYAVGLRLRMLSPDVVIFCRYSGLQAKEICDLAQSQGIPTIFHIDDDLLNVPITFGEHKYRFHNNPARLSAVRYLLEHVDIVYAANPRLAKHLQSLARVRATFAGSIYCASDVYREPSPTPTNRIGYMGFDHAEDFTLVSSAIEIVMKKNERLTFTMFGPVPIPDVLQQFGNRVRVIESVRDYEVFRQRLANECWDVGLCPLMANHFNCLKSDTKWVEYTASGMATIASAGTIYDECCADECGITVGSNIQDWLAAIEALVGDNARRVEVATNAQEKLRKRYSPKALEDQIWQVLDEARAAADTAA